MKEYKTIGMEINRKMYDKFKAQCVQEDVGVYAAIEQLIERDTVLDPSSEFVESCCEEARENDLTFCPECGKRLKLDHRLWRH